MFFSKPPLSQLEKNEIAFDKEYQENLRFMTTYRPPRFVKRAKVNPVPAYVWKIFMEYMEIENRLDLPFIDYLKI